MLYAITVVLISAISVYRVSNKTNEMTSRINASNKAQQDKWKQKIIDANLITKGRIEWIENVRKTTSKLLSCYYTILDTEDIATAYTNCLKARKTTELLILYFGPEGTGLLCEVYDQELLLNTKDNIVKNNSIVLFLVELSKKFNQYYVDLKDGTFQDIEKTKEDALKEIYDFELIEDG